MSATRKLIESSFVDYGDPGDEKPEWGLDFNAYFDDDHDPGDLHDDAWEQLQYNEWQAKVKAVETLIPFLRRRGVEIEEIEHDHGPHSIDEYKFFGGQKEARRVQSLIDSAGLVNVKVSLNPNSAGRNHNLNLAVRVAMNDLRAEGVKHLRVVDCDNKSFGRESWARSKKKKWCGSRYEFKLPKGDKYSSAMDVAASIVVEEAGELACQRGELDPFDPTEDIKHLAPAYVVKDASAACTKRRGRKEATVTKEFDNIPDAIAMVKELVLKASRS